MRRVCLVISLVCLLICAYAAIGLTAELRFSWTYSADSTKVVGFHLYGSTQSGVYSPEDRLASVDYITGQTIFTTDTIVQGVPGQETSYYFVATAYGEGEESDYSNEVSYRLLGEPKELTFTVTINTQ